MQPIGRRRALLAGAGIAATALAGCSDDGGGGDDDPADRGPIEIDELAFAADRPTGRGEYEPQPEATYERGDLIWLYVAYEGVSGQPVDSGNDGDGDGGNASSEEVTGEEAEGGQADREDDAVGPDVQATDRPRTVVLDLHQELTVDDPNGERVVESETDFLADLAPSKLERYYTATEILLPGDVVPGEYETTVSVTDRVSETDATASATFQIAD